MKEGLAQKNTILVQRLKYSLNLFNNNESGIVGECIVVQNLCRLVSLYRFFILAKVYKGTL